MKYVREHHSIPRNTETLVARGLFRKFVNLGLGSVADYERYLASVSRNTMRPFQQAYDRGDRLDHLLDALA